MLRPATEQDESDVTKLHTKFFWGLQLGFAGAHLYGETKKSDADRCLPA
jgi:hypothetical protein